MSSKTAREADLLCFSHLRWGFVTQRPQHLLSHAARDRRVFYWEEPIWHRDTNELPPRKDGGLGMHLEFIQEADVLVIRPHLTWGIDFEAGQQILLAEFMSSFDIQNYIAWYYTPMAFGFAHHLQPELTVYDCMDELSAFRDAPAQLAERERQLLAAADVVFTGGVSLYEAKRRQHGNVHAFPSSIDVKHFAQARQLSVTAEPLDQHAIPHPRAGFYGVIDERLDLELLQNISRLRPEVNFIVLGPVAKIDPINLPQADNIHYLGRKSYDELPSYLAGWDVALMPFALNEATRYISPTKTPEYLAAGKPVVSTPIRDVVQSYGDCGLVAIAATAEAFASAIDEALQPQPVSWARAVARKLATSSWGSTWTSMQREMKHVAGRGESIAVQDMKSIQRDLHSDSALSSRTSRRPHRESFDYLIVGAGFAGCVLAERLTNRLGKRVLLIDKRDHVGGNAYDFHNEHGLLVHKYGPHIFHTNSEKVLNYLSHFTAWRSYEHRVLSSVDGQLLPVPINLDTINRLYGLSLDAAGMEAFLAERTIQSTFIRTSEDIVISRVGRELYEKFFRNYTRKQWGMDPSQLDASVAGRIPVRFNHDDRYFSDRYQVMPVHGYTKMFERMIDQPNLSVRTGAEFEDVARTYRASKIIYTGPIDEFFDFRFGRLPYRSLRFRHETHDRAIFQSAPVVNYPNDHDYTRITEFKYLTGQKHAKTSVVYEYPQQEGDPYYPIPRPENTALYERYQQLAARDENVQFCGRLGSYRYLNMDQVVAQALTIFERIAQQSSVQIQGEESRVVDRADQRVAIATATNQM